MSFVKAALQRLDLSRFNLGRRFAVLLGGIAVVTLIVFVSFARYSIGLTEHEFEQRGELLARTLAEESVYNLLMQDTEGLQERLKAVVGNGSTIAGGFFDAEGTLLVEQSLKAKVAEKDRPVREGEPTRWATATGGTSILVARAEVVNATDKQKLGYVVVALPGTTLQAQKRTSLILSLVIPGCLALLTGLILLLVSRTVIRPVVALRTAAGSVEQGNLDVQVNINQRDEIGELAASFNAMVAASARNVREIQEHTEQAEAAKSMAEQLQREADDERHYLQQQFRAISEVIAAVTQGDLTRHLVIERDDAVGSLMHQINQMISDLEGLIREVHGATNRLTQAGHQVATAAEEMSAGAQGQASQTMEVAAAIEEMTATIGESSHNAHEANQMANRASKLASSGEEVFRATSNGMSRIAGIVKESAEKVTALGASSAQIGEIVQVIGDIADQTNLLALNAAIEAARAGEQGRGFAVVADEVRKLAERTTSATKEIGQMIRRIQQNTDVVVASMTRGNEEVSNGLRLADDASRSLSEIVSSINGMVLMIDQIATASQQQSASSSQISRNVEAISAVASEVSRATSDLAHTADAVNHQSESLQRLIERFRLRSSASRYEPVPAYGDGAAYRVA